MNWNAVIIISSFFVLFAIAYQVSKAATINDYGTRGHTFPIIEESLLDVIIAKLNSAAKSGLLKEMQQEFKERVKKKILRPVPVKNLTKATENRSWIYDPTYVQKADIKTGIIIVKAGTRVNPLETISWGEPLILIDGDDENQVAWAKSKSGKLVLVNGSPIELSNQLGRHVCFDQWGNLVRLFSIKAVPAIVEQNNTMLSVMEISISQQ